MKIFWHRRTKNRLTVICPQKWCVYLTQLCQPCLIELNHIWINWLITSHKAIVLNIKFGFTVHDSKTFYSKCNVEQNVIFHDNTFFHYLSEYFGTVFFDHKQFRNVYICLFFALLQRHGAQICIIKIVQFKIYSVSLHYIFS